MKFFSLEFRLDMVLSNELSWSSGAHDKVERASNWRQMPWVSVISRAMCLERIRQAGPGACQAQWENEWYVKTEIGGGIQSNRLEEDSDLMGTSQPSLTLGAQDSKWCQNLLLRASHKRPRCTLLDWVGRRCKGLSMSSWNSLSQTRSDRRVLLLESVNHCTLWDVSILTLQTFLLTLINWRHLNEPAVQESKWVSKEPSRKDAF